MRSSDIFDSFTKIALEQGIIKNASPEELKKKLEENPRMDSLDISAIEALYGVKPDQPKDMKYKRNIIDDAHPNAVVISPAHDKINGLVENLNERQDIILNILDKVPNGHLTQRKYAEKQFILSLVKLGNHLDNIKNDKLRILADTCLKQATDTIKKKAFKKTADPVTISIIVGVVVVVGALYLKQHLRFINDGFIKNHEKLIAEVDDILGSASSFQTQIGAGQEYVASFIKEMTDFKKRLTGLSQLYTKLAPLINNLEKPRTSEELVQLASSPQTKEVASAYNAFRAYAENLMPYLETISKNFESESYKLRQIQDKGILMRMVDAPQIFHGGKGLVADDFDDIRHAIPTYIMGIKEVLDIFANAESRQTDAKNKFEQAMSKSQSEFGVAPAFESTLISPDSTTKPPTTFVSQEPGESTVEQEAQKLEEELGNLGITGA